MRLALAALHLLALGIGLGAVLDRAASLRGSLDGGSLKRAFRADTMWGVAAGIWISTGLWRLFAATEKSTAYYLGNHAFWAKMGFLVLVLLLEGWPMVTLIRWRIAIGRGGAPESVASVPLARRIATISVVETVLVVAMVGTAVAMARGYGSR